jgi:hypothetical protein
MTHMELWNRIKLTMEDPPAIIEFDRRNGFAWWEDDVPHATPGVCVAMIGNDLTDKFIDRGFRANLIEWEWSYLMHFEMAIDALFKGNTIGYNRTGFFPFVEYQFFPEINEDNWMILKKLFV